MALETTSRKDCLLVRDGSLLAVVLPRLANQPSSRSLSILYGPCSATNSSVRNRTLF